MQRNFTIIAALLGMTGVALGAFGAHGLEAHFSANPDLEPTFQTASEYHLIHAVALVVVGWAVTQWHNRWTQLAGWLLVVGVLLFSGSLYVLSIFDVRIMGAVAPLGGTALIAGWASLGVGAWRGTGRPPHQG